MIKLKKGTLCYFHSSSQNCLLKCKVVRVEESKRQDDKRVGHVVARITTRRDQVPENMQNTLYVNSETWYGNILPREAYVEGLVNKPFEVVIDGDEA